MKHEVPYSLRLALRVLLGHVEPGWENTKAVVQMWLDEVTAESLKEVDEERREKSGTFLGSLAEHPAPDEYHRATQRPYGGDCGVRTSELLKGHKPKADEKSG